MSDMEQKNATKKTCFFNIPCLRTKMFWGPIAIINENPRNKPVIKDSYIKNDKKICWFI